MKTLVLLTSLMVFPLQNFAHQLVPETSLEASFVKKKKKKGGIFKKKCKCPKVK